MKNKYEGLNASYTELYNDVLDALKEEIKNSNHKSKFVDSNSITVNVFDYSELVLINDELLFLDSKGCQYSLESDCQILDFIDILNNLN